MRKIIGRIKDYLFLLRVKSSGGVAIIPAYDTMAKWVNVYAGFLNDKEKTTFYRLLKEGRIVESSKTWACPTGRECQEYEHFKIYNKT